MSVTKIRPSGLFAMKRTRFKPSTATLIPNSLGKLSENDPALRPFVRVIRFGARESGRVCDCKLVMGNTVIIKKRMILSMFAVGDVITDY